MNLKSGFNLFVRQALLYPLTSPFLPAPADVKKDVSYANNALVGELEGGAVSTVWQVSYNHIMNYANALIYAQYLGADGETVEAIPQNIWRIPTLAEIHASITQRIVDTTQGKTPVVAWPTLVENYYWSSDYYTLGVYNFAAFEYDGVFYPGGLYLTDSNYVRCVKI